MMLRKNLIVEIDLTFDNIDSDRVREIDLLLLFCC